MTQHMELYVYSGTGNTWKVAQTLCDAAVLQGVDCAILPIDAKTEPKKHQPASDRLLGLMAPTLGTIQPWSFFRFILHLPNGKRQPVFLAATGAWTKIGKLFVPGYIGFGLYLAALILLIKGYTIVGVEGFGMPHNWTTLIPPYRESLEDKINCELPTAAERFVTQLLSGKRVFHRIGDLIISILIFPLPLLFLLFGHKFLAKTMFAGKSCNGCGLCAQNCPNHAIRMLGKRRRPYWTYRCEQCMRCVGYCPQKAVDCNSLIVLAFVALFAAIPVESALTRALFHLLPSMSGLMHGLIAYLLYYAVVLALAAVIYALFHLMGRIPVVSRFMTRLSFTHYWRKYRHADVSVKALTDHNTDPL